MKSRAQILLGAVLSAFLPVCALCQPVEPAVAPDSPFTKKVSNAVDSPPSATVKGDGADATLAGRQRNAELLTGSFTILPRWIGVHPRLFASGEELDRVAARHRKDPTVLAAALPAEKGAELTGLIAPFEKGENAHRNAIYVARLAVAYRVTRDERYLARLREWMPTFHSYAPPAMGSIGDIVGLNAGHVLLGFAIAYDVLKGQGDVELENALLGVLLRQSDRTFRDIIALRTFPYEQNHLVIPVCGLALTASLLADTHPAATEWGIFSNNILDRSIQTLARDGWFFEGISYWNYTTQFPLSYAVAIQRVTGKRVLDAPYFKHAPEYLAHMTLPNPRFAFDFGDWGPRVEPDGLNAQKGYDWPWHTLPTSIKKFIPRLLLREDPRNGLLRDYLAKTANEAEPMTGHLTIDAVFQLLSADFDQGAAAGSVQTSPPYHYFNDMEVMHWRNNWQDKNATALAFKSGPPAGHFYGSLLKKSTFPGWKPVLGHAHPDAGSFILYGHGAFLANDTGYTGVKETADHNSILVDGIGQHQGGTAWDTFNGKPYDQYDRIRMDNVWLGDKVAAGTAIYEAAYDDALKLESVRRDLIMIEGRFLVILDRLSSATDHEYAWRWHSDQPALFYGKNRFVMTNGGGRIVLENLNEVASAKVAPTVVDANIYRKNPPRPQQRGYHLALTSPRQKQFEFLTAMCIQASSEDPDGFKVTRSTPRTVTLSDGKKEYSLWLEGAENLEGKFAYVIRDGGGKIEAVGLHGKSLETPEITIECESSGQVSATRDSAGGWSMDQGDRTAKISLRE